MFYTADGRIVKPVYALKVTAGLRTSPIQGTRLAEFMDGDWHRDPNLGHEFWDREPKTCGRGWHVALVKRLGQWYDGTAGGQKVWLVQVRGTYSIASDKLAAEFIRFPFESPIPGRLLRDMMDHLWSWHNPDQWTKAQVREHLNVPDDGRLLFDRDYYRSEPIWA